MTRGRVAAAAVVAVAVFFGWWLFLFLTDDAYIAFRYAANSLHGWGLTWNPPPFEPVEGYTSFLWVVLLREVWRVTGIVPPEAANVLSLLFGYATLFVGARLLLRMDFPEPFARHRNLWLGLALAGTLTNRTFLTWLSSGLETSMFNFFLTWWIYVVSAPPVGRGSRWVLWVSTSGALAALTRPDGLLAVAGSVVVLTWVFARERPLTIRRAMQTLPLLLVPIHLLWRYATYGAWVPNTYFAKNPGFWPESGVRYLASFLVENGGWLWLGFAGVWSAYEIRRRRRLGTPPTGSEWVRPAVPVVVLSVHAGYYALVIGGDHFEYRVLSHLVLPSFLTAPWLVSRWARDARTAAAWLLLLLVVSWPIPWSHWVHSRHLDTRAETWKMTVPVAPHWPAALRPLVTPWDRWQAWLIDHQVGSRHQEHKVFHRTQLRTWPAREEGRRLRWEPLRPVLPERTVGVPGWVFPEVAILDVLGLNDPVIARGPPVADDPAHRNMAHDRRPPEGYVECFEPNVRIAEDGGIAVVPRRRPLTDERIRTCQDRFRTR